MSTMSLFTSLYVCWFVGVVLLSHAYCAEQCVVNSVDKLGVDSRVIYGVKRSVRLSLGKDRGGRKETEGERQHEGKNCFPIVKQLWRLGKF